MSKTISLSSIKELTRVLRRPPLIWDNIHANDYDQKRIYLGPFAGRSPSLIPHLAGVLTNPNCEFEPNYVALHTLATWSQCKAQKETGKVWTVTIYSHRMVYLISCKIQKCVEFAESTRITTRSPMLVCIKLLSLKLHWCLSYYCCSHVNQYHILQSN